MTRPNYPEPIIVGYTVEAVPGAETLLETPEPPANYGPEAAEKWRKDPTKGGKQLRDTLFQAAYSKVTGRLTSIFAVDPLKGEIFDSQELRKDKRTKDLVPAVAFAVWLENRMPKAFRAYPGRLGVGNNNALCFFGFDPKQFVRVLGVECQLNGHAVPLGLWYQNEDCFNPYDMVVEADRRKALPLCSLLQAIGVAHAPDYRPHEDAEEDARLAVEIIHCFGLLPPTDEEKLYGIVQDNLAPIDEIEDEEVEVVADDDAEEEVDEEEVDDEDDDEEEVDVEEVDVDDDDEEEVDEDDDEDDDEYEYEYEDEEVEDEEVAEEPAPPPGQARRKKQSND